MTSTNGHYICTREGLSVLVGFVGEQNTVYVPDADGLKFVHLRDVKNIQFPLPRVKISPKEFLLPQTECLFAFNERSPDAGFKDANDSGGKNSVLLGVSPCDACAVVLLDKVFLGQSPQDPYYKMRRERTKIIAMACTHPALSCFCTSVDTGPDSSDGTDIFITAMEGRFMIEAITPWGKEMVHGVQPMMYPVSDKDVAEKSALMRDAKAKINSKIEIKSALAKLDDFQAPWWDRYHQKCLGCGACTFLCPTCHCFDITDETIGKQGRRIRTWDSCQYSLFTAHASGHNPRQTQKERMRQRIMHKFNYSVKNFNSLFCVGCGRCVQYCPVNLDIRNVLRDIVEAT
jgi:sulfhydrogenase subunit beta (sulfur reductase)